MSDDVREPPPEEGLRDLVERLTRELLEARLEASRARLGGMEYVARHVHKALDDAGVEPGGGVSVLSDLFVRLDAMRRLRGGGRRVRPC